MDEFTRADLCPTIYEVMAQSCPMTGVKAEDLSGTLQRTYGTELVYAVLSKELGVCLSTVLHLNYQKRNNSCRLFDEEIIKTCPPTDNWEINILLSRIDEGYHISILLINHKLMQVEYFEPNGSASWTFACGKTLREWAQQHYKDYFFIFPEDVCPVGPQAVLGEGTCWLWSSLYFYLRVRCPDADPGILIESLLTMEKSELNDLVTRFGCYLMETGNKLHLDVVTPLYFSAQKILRNDIFDPTIAEFSQRLERYYLTAQLKALTNTILSSDELVFQIDPQLIRHAELIMASTNGGGASAAAAAAR